MKCPHTIPPSDAHRDMFGNGAAPCHYCSELRGLYDDCFYAMGGNVYSLARLAAAGYIPGSRPTLADLNTASVALYAKLDSGYKSALGAELEGDIKGRLNAETGG